MTIALLIPCAGLALGQSAPGGSPGTLTSARVGDTGEAEPGVRELDRNHAGTLTENPTLAASGETGDFGFVDAKTVSGTITIGGTEVGVNVTVVTCKRTGDDCKRNPDGSFEPLPKP